MSIYSHDTYLESERQSVFNWFERKGAFERIMPPWEKLKILDRNEGITDDSYNIFRIKIGPIPKKWYADHYGYIKNSQFCDKQLKGPFWLYEHQHKFEDRDSNKCVMKDIVTYKLPFHFISKYFTDWNVKGRFKKLFRWREVRLQNDLRRHGLFSNNSRRILISGSTGFIGNQLVCFLRTGGHDVVRLVRPNTNRRLISDEEVIEWDPDTNRLNSTELENFDAIINLAGVGIGDKRWSKKRKNAILESRISATTLLSKTISHLNNPPHCFISSSAIGYYGDKGDYELDEESDAGSGFSATVAKQWEECTEYSKNAGVNTILLRTGIVISPSGGALSRMLLPFKMGVGGKIGSGKQYMSWVSHDDIVYAIHHLLMTDAASGAYNITSPNPVTSKQFAKTLGRVLRRPTIIPLPSFVIKILFGEMGKELLLEGQKAKPKRLIEEGFQFTHGNLDECLTDFLGAWR